jgi:two-component system chemotaxis response regulator CheB
MTKQTPEPTRAWPPTHRCIAIGASGREGLDDIKELLAALPDPLPAIALVVLHRPADRFSYLREVLARATHLKVEIAEEGEALELGVVYIGEPDHHLKLVAGHTADLVADPDNKHRNRTIDMLFYSLAAHAGKAAIGVVLSGSLDDGSRGLAAIHKARGVTMVLTPERGPSAGMPQNAIDYDGPINVIGSPTFIAGEIAKLLAKDPYPRLGTEALSCVEALTA